jgi:hypothetical protein
MIRNRIEAECRGDGVEGREQAGAGLSRPATSNKQLAKHLEALSTIKVHIEKSWKY